MIENPALRNQVTLDDYISESVGLPTLKDIKAELDKPGRDPREKFEPFSFADGINTMEDLQQEMELPGIITNITAFGAFVDIGVHQDGLVHISELSDKFVKDPADVVKVHQKVKVKVLDIDIPRKRISLSMKKPAPREQKGQSKKRHPGKSTKKSSQNQDKASTSSLASRLTLGS